MSVKISLCSRFILGTVHNWLVTYGTGPKAHEHVSVPHSRAQADLSPRLEQSPYFVS